MRCTPTLLCALAVLLGSFAGRAEEASYVPAHNAVPDLCQTDPKGNFAGGGRSFCGPVAVSNSFMALYREDFKWNDVSHHALANRLASQSFMNTDAEKGTSVKQLLRGVELFLEDRGERDYYLKFQGWRRPDLKHRTGVFDPQLAWIRRLLSQGGAVWLNVGWYEKTEEAGELRRIGGHWVTAVGYGQDEAGHSDPDYLLIHDPAPRAGREPSCEYVKMTLLEEGILKGPMRGLPRTAHGLYRMEDGMHVKKTADCAILDGAVGMLLKPPGEPEQGQEGRSPHSSSPNTLR